jgi:hypothetical protein
METEQTISLTDRMREALAELEEMIVGQYPTATFTVSRGEDDPEDVHLNATVDLEDPDEVLDLVIDRVLQLQLDEELAIHVIPVRTLQRVAALMNELESQKWPGSSGRSRSA